MPFIPVICTIQVLVPSRLVAPHLIRPLEEWFVLNSVYDLMYWLLEHHVHFPH